MEVTQSHPAANEYDWGKRPESALADLVDRMEYARKRGGSIPVTDAFVQLIAAAVVDLAAIGESIRKELRDAVK